MAHGKWKMAKRAAAGAALLLLLGGCLQYRPAQFPLELGDAIQFSEPGRAGQFRKATGNDPYGNTAAVPITRPTLVQCE